MIIIFNSSSLIFLGKDVVLQACAHRPGSSLPFDDWMIGEELVQPAPFISRTALSLSHLSLHSFEWFDPIYSFNRSPCRDVESRICNRVRPTRPKSDKKGTSVSVCPCSFVRGCKPWIHLTRLTNHEYSIHFISSTIPQPNPTYKHKKGLFESLAGMDQESNDDYAGDLVPTDDDPKSPVRPYFFSLFSFPHRPVITQCKWLTSSSIITNTHTRGG